MTVRPEAEVTVSVEVAPEMLTEKGRVRGRRRVQNLEPCALWEGEQKEGRARPCPRERFSRTLPTSRDPSSWGLRQGRRVGSRKSEDKPRIKATEFRRAQLPPFTDSEVQTQGA